MIPLGILGSARVAASASLASEILALSPAGYWKLDETSGTTATDSSGNARHGTYAGTYTLAARNGFPTFAGGYVDIPDTSAWSIGTAPGLTVFGLFYVNAATGQQFLVSKGSASNYEWGCYVTATTTESVMWSVTGQTQQGEQETATPPAASWHAIAFTTPNATRGTRQALYRDSGTALTTTQTTLGSVGTIGDRTAPVRIAGRADAAAPLTGAAAHVAIFPGALTAAQVGTLMTAAASEGLI